MALSPEAQAQSDAIRDKLALEIETMLVATNYSHQDAKWVSAKVMDGLDRAFAAAVAIFPDNPTEEDAHLNMQAMYTLMTAISVQAHQRAINMAGSLRAVMGERTTLSMDDITGTIQ
jgi:hypothetical protein